MLNLLNGSLALLILGLAIWVIVAREAFAAVAGFMVYGLLLALVWVQLQGIDIALTEAAIGGGLTGVLLIGAVTRLRAAEASIYAVRPSVWLRWLAGGLSLAVTLLLALCVLALPDPAPTLAHAVVANIDATGVGNPITAVLLAFRSLDTLLEAIVLLLALIGVWSLAPESVWDGRPSLAQQLETNGILAYAARLMVPVGIVAGGYIF
ncbi:hydrogenase subunit MbhD domain-containing protein, partial [Aeromonas sp. HMWF014]